MHGQCNKRFMVSFPATGTELSLVTEGYLNSEQLLSGVLGLRGAVNKRYAY